MAKGLPRKGALLGYGVVQWLHPKMSRCQKGRLLQRGLCWHPLVLCAHGVTGGCQKQSVLLSSRPQGLRHTAQKLWPRLKRGRHLVNQDGGLVVRDWELGAWLQCLASPPPCSLMAHVVLWACPTFTLACVFSALAQQHFDFLDTFSFK